MLLQLMFDISEFSVGVDVVFFVIVYEVSYDLVLQFFVVGCVVFDFFGVFCVNDGVFYEKYYGFIYQYFELFKQVVYGLVEWSVDVFKEVQLIVVSGCYLMVVQLLLKLLIDVGLLDFNQWLVINVISGVSGVGCKVVIGNSFCEVSLQLYGIFNYCYQLEIVSYFGVKVIFILYLGNFKCGILEIIICCLKLGVGYVQIVVVYQQVYVDKLLVCLYDKGVFVVKSVEGLLFCDIGFVVQDDYFIVVVVEDNLLKGVVVQVVQCVNICFGFVEMQFFI